MAQDLGFDYRVVRTARRTLCVQVLRRTGEVVVRAPLHASERAIGDFLCSRRDWVCRHVAESLSAAAAHPPIGEAERAELFRRARAYLPERTAYYAAIMGVQPEGVRITGAEQRFGSCNSRRRICYSYRLMRYPAAAIDAVVVHELAHLRQMNHSPSFYRVVESVLPDYRARMKLLRG